MSVFAFFVRGISLSVSVSDSVCISDSVSVSVGNNDRVIVGDYE